MKRIFQIARVISLLFLIMSLTLWRQTAKAETSSFFFHSEQDVNGWVMDNELPTGQLASLKLGVPPEGVGYDLVFFSRYGLSPVGFEPGEWSVYLYVSQSTMSSMFFDIGESTGQMGELFSSLWKSIIWTPVEGWNEITWSDSVIRTIASGRYMAIDIRPYSGGSATILWDTDTFNSRLATPSLRDIVPPKITITSPGFMIYKRTTIPLLFTINEPTSWISYSLDDQANVTITGNTTLASLSLGKHKVRVYANDTSGNMGKSDPVYFNVFLVLPHAPKVNFTATPSVADIGETVEFDASDSLPGWNGTHNKPITTYLWNFGDGNKTSTNVPVIQHSFSNQGIFPVTLTVYAPGATPDTDTMSQNVDVVIMPPVGGYLAQSQWYDTNLLARYVSLLTILTASFVTVKHKTTRNKKQFLIRSTLTKPSKPLVNQVY